MGTEIWRWLKNTRKIVSASRKGFRTILLYTIFLVCSSIFFYFYFFHIRNILFFHCVLINIKHLADHVTKMDLTIPPFLKSKIFSYFISKSSFLSVLEEMSYFAASDLKLSLRSTQRALCGEPEMNSTSMQNMRSLGLFVWPWSLDTHTHTHTNTHTHTHTHT